VLLVPPAGRLLQALKSAGTADSASDLAALGRAIVARLPRPGLVVLGPGTTTRAVGEALGLATTLLGVDVAALGADGSAALLAMDAGEAELVRWVGRQPTVIVVSPVGGQGFVLGRGNQQLSPLVIRRAGLGNLVVAATPGKLAALRGRPLLLDSGDPGLDQDLSGHIRVVTGPDREAICRLEPG
jgi:predicted polyphosphate/ATP-dependent NAD kinase